MKKKTIAMLLVAAFALAAGGAAFAGDKGNWRKGKYLFRKNCRVCHTAGKAAKDLSPVTYKQAEWKKIFADGKVACKDKWAKVGNKGMTDIYSYLHGHAADSPTPAKCK